MFSPRQLEFFALHNDRMELLTYGLLDLRHCLNDHHDLRLWQAAWAVHGAPPNSTGELIVRNSANKTRPDASSLLQSKS
jgi:hypothetical protein